MLKVYSDRSLIPNGTPHAVIFYPFWGKNPEDPVDPNSGRFDEYAALGSRHLELAPLEAADVAVFPLDWSSVQGEAQIGSADLFEAELMTDVAFGALSHRAICRRCAHSVAALTGEVRNC